MVLLLIVCGVLLLVDLVTKIVTASVSEIVIIKGVLSISSHRNTGAAFGIFEGGGIWLVIATSLLIGLVVAFYVLHKNKTRFFNIAFAFFLAGALGNFIDRIFLGYVRDFINFDFISWFLGLFSPGYRFPVCNLADVFLNAAVVLLAIYFIFLDKAKADSKNNTKSVTSADEGDG